MSGQASSTPTFATTWLFLLFSLGLEEFCIKSGNRIAQLILERICRATLLEENFS